MLNIIEWVSRTFILIPPYVGLLDPTLTEANTKGWRSLGLL